MRSMNHHHHRLRLRCPLLDADSPRGARARQGIHQCVRMTLLEAAAGGAHAKRRPARLPFPHGLPRPSSKPGPPPPPARSSSTIYLSMHGHEAAGYVSARPTGETSCTSCLRRLVRPTASAPTPARPSSGASVSLRGAARRGRGLADEPRSHGASSQHRRGLFFFLLLLLLLLPVPLLRAAPTAPRDAV